MTCPIAIQEIEARRGRAAVSSSLASVERAKKSIAEIEDIVRSGMHTLMRTQARLEKIAPPWCAIVPSVVLAVVPVPEVDIRTIDGHGFVEAEDAEQRMHLIRGEGLQLLAGYQAISDQQIRRTFVSLVRRLSERN